MSKAEDPLVNCPLEVVHRIRKSRMQTHLVKCLKNHDLSSSRKLKCPYNPLHIIEAVEIMYHCQSCPDSAEVLTDQYSTEGVKCYSGVISAVEHVQHYNALVPEVHEWDLQYSTQGTAYDPTRDIESKPVLRSLNCESKSKRRAFKYQERQRFAAIDNNKHLTKQSEAPSDVNKPLREPNELKSGITTEGEPKLNIVVENNKTPDNITVQLLEPNDDETKENVLCGQYKPKNILVHVNNMQLESTTNALSHLQLLQKPESAIEKKKIGLMRLMPSTSTTDDCNNPISYCDAAELKSAAVMSDMNDKKLQQSRIRTKYAANFITAHEQSGGL